MDVDLGHAILSPSASGRWLTCPAAVRMTRDLPQEESSVYAREGTQFHTLCELTARHRLLEGSDAEYERDFLDWALETDPEWQEDQLRYVEDWIEFLRECLDDDPRAVLYLEQRVDTGIPGCWGTADAIIVYSDHLRVIDIKYGAGYRVSALENSQARLYGIGALNTVVEDPMTIHTVTNTIWQPRMDNISEETLTRRDLLKWKAEVKPIAALALSEDAPFKPTEDACRWCPIAGTCAPRMRHMLNQDYGDPDIMTGEDMAEAYSRTSELKRWITDIEDAALKQAYEDAGSVPGFKVVRSGGRRTIPDKAKAIDALVNAGFELDQVSNRSLVTLEKLDKLTEGPDKLQQVLGDLLVKSEGRLSLAPDSDPRPSADAIHSAQTDFADIANEGVA